MKFKIFKKGEQIYNPKGLFKICLTKKVNHIFSSPFSRLPCSMCFVSTCTHKVLNHPWMDAPSKSTSHPHPVLPTPGSLACSYKKEKGQIKPTPCIIIPLGRGERNFDTTISCTFSPYFLFFFSSP